MQSVFVKYLILLISIHTVFGESSSHSDDKAIPTPTIQSSERCVIPDLPQMKHLLIRKHPRNETINVGTIVENFETIHIECKDSTNADINWDLNCLNGLFDPEFPSCSCDGSYLRRLSLRTSCPDEKDCSDKVPLGTTVEVRCAYGYTRIPNEVQYLKCLENGNFDKRPISCKQECGKLAHESATIGKEGIPIDSSNAPWHVAVVVSISGEYQYVCGGAIVSPRIILSAAHCFFNEQTFSLETIDFQIIAGSKTSNYTTEQSEYAQIVKVILVQIPINFAGKSAYNKGDIAILKLETPLKYSPTVAPLCLPKNVENDPSSYIESNLKGYISIFDSHNQLDVLNMTTLSFFDCKAVATEAEIADDKFCIYNSEIKTLRRGNSGAPFFVTTTAEGIESAQTFVYMGLISHIVEPSETSEYIIALTNIFYVDAKFRKKLERAIKDDEKLF